MQVTRRYDIDWLRVIAIWLLLLYHIAIGFQPWGALIGFIQNGESMDSLKGPMAMLNVWRIPILFYISGMGVGFAIRKRNAAGLLLERSRRILIPFLFGMLCIVPLHILLWQQYYRQDLAFRLQPAHLWFLANIFVYVLIFLPFFIYLKNRPQGSLSLKVKKLMGSAWGLLLMIGCFVLEAWLVNPEAFEYYAMNKHGFFLGLLAFLFGFLIIHSEDSFWNRVLSIRWGLLLGAVLLYAIRWTYFDFVMVPKYLLAIESNLWIFSLFAFGYTSLNHESRTLQYLSKAAYPIYILHMLFIYLGSILIFPWDISTTLKFVLVTLFTFAGCYLSYEGIRRAKFLRPLFGLRYERGD